MLRVAKLPTNTLRSKITGYGSVGGHVSVWWKSDPRDASWSFLASQRWSLIHTFFGAPPPPHPFPSPVPLQSVSIGHHPTCRDRHYVGALCIWLVNQFGCMTVIFCMHVHNCEIVCVVDFSHRSRTIHLENADRLAKSAISAPNYVQMAFKYCNTLIHILHGWRQSSHARMFIIPINSYINFK